MINFDILNYIFIGIIFIISITVHEYAHVAAANALGDPTGKLSGRLTLNPLKHIDPIGFILLFLIGFGWGRPAPYNPNYLRNPYRDELIVALAGPATNILLGIIAIIVIVLYIALTGENFASLGGSQNLLLYFWMKFSLLNFALAAFNMIPLPPLDGYRLIKITNHKAGARLEQNTFWISLLFLALVVFGPFEGVLHTYIIGVADFLFRFFIFPLSQLFF